MTGRRPSCLGTSLTTRLTAQVGECYLLGLPTCRDRCHVCAPIDIVLFARFALGGARRTRYGRLPMPEDGLFMTRAETLGDRSMSSESGTHPANRER